jgi:hypothetical protein
VRRDAAGRLVAEVDRHGAPLTDLDWAPDGRLHRAAVRVPDGSWLTVEPRAAEPGPWGASDELREGDRSITRFGAVEWARIDRIPPLAEPARLPAGGGTAVLNLIARLAAEQGAQALRYDGPYPTEQLFLALLESFRWAGDTAGNPLATFTAGGLTWIPAPHTRSFESGGVYVQRRERVEKIVVGGRAFYRPDWQGVGRRTPRVIRDVGGTVRASLQALGVVLEDQVVLDADGAVRDIPQRPADPAGARPLPAPLVAGLVATLIARSAPPLADFIRSAAGQLAFEWAPVAADLVEIERARVRLSPRMLSALKTVLGRAGTRVERLGAAVAALEETSELIGDELRRRAQATLGLAQPEVQEAALRRTLPTAGDADAGAIALAVEALLGAAEQLA